MNLPAVIRTVRWMVRDTFRQAVATRLFWVMLAVTAVCTLFCLSVDVSGDSPAPPDADFKGVLPKSEAEKLGLQKLKNDGVRVISGEATFGFGAFKAPLGRNRDDAVKMIQVWLAAAVADTAGVLLALLWTAGFLPSFLDPQSATVLLSKPAPRWAVLAGKYAGVVLFVGFNALLFVTATWLALGLKTGVWTTPYWLAVPLAVVNFGVFYSASAFLAVCTRSTVAAAFGTLLFWLVCWALNYTHHLLSVTPPEGMTTVAQFALDVGYWVLPKPFDLTAIFHDAMLADGYAVKADEMRRFQESGKFAPGLSVLASAAFAAVTLALAGYEFEMAEY